MRRNCTKKVPGLGTSTKEFNESFKDQMVPVLCKLFHSVEKEGKLPGFF